MESKQRYWRTIALSAAIALIVLVLAPLAGSAPLDFRRALAGQSPEYEVLMQLRLSRVLLAMPAGGALSLAGVAINSMCLALIQFVHSLAGFSKSFSISRWLMGGVDAVDYATLAWLAL